MAKQFLQLAKIEIEAKSPGQKPGLLFFDEQPTTSNQQLPCLEDFAYPETEFLGFSGFGNRHAQQVQT
jgi:hypothetical protein